VLYIKFILHHLLLEPLQDG